ncbi:hypothetical protein BDR26DRAFT_850423 [Obelidium mucronatum]|nr:hypothetical protein BDR26DRAFT_850423 [Obelidium mucronatum]
MKSNPSVNESLLATSWSWAKHLLVGATFGFALEKAKVYLPSVIISQMKWTQVSMLVVFVTATVTGLASISLLEKFGIFKRSPKPPTAFGAHCLNGYGGNIVGGALVGVGMTLSGACPGTVLLQIGTGVPSAPYVAAGVLLGSVTYGYFENYLKTRLFSKFGSKKSCQTLDCPAASSLTIAAIASIVALPVLYYASNSLIPWRSEFFEDFAADFRTQSFMNPFTHVGDMELSLTSPAWSPFAAGLAIGATQLLSVLVTDSVIGASSVYPYVGSVFVRLFDRKWETTAPFYKGYLDMAYSVRFSVGVMAGAFLSAKLGGLPIGYSGIDFQEPQIMRLFVGGVALVYGSRIAGGCTSGHGLSGLAQLSVASLVTVCAMVGAGTFSALLF